MLNFNTRRRGLVPKLFCIIAIASMVGCVGNWKLPAGKHDTTKSYYDRVATRIEYPDVQSCPSEATTAALSATSPFTLEDPSQLPTWDLSLEDAVRMAVGNGPVLRNIAVNVVNTPGATSTVYDPALVEANPLGGVEAALSAYDAQVAGQLFWQKNNVPRNINRANPIVTQFAAVDFEQTLGTYTSEISKLTATGAKFAARHNVIYDYNNTPNRFFRSDFSGFFEAEYRQPLMQGAGTTFNRIAGPGNPIGQYNGVLLARVNNDISLTDFEASVIQLASDVEQAYWDLYTAYRFLEAQLRGRESALQTFQYQQVRLKVGAGRSDEEAQARSQYYAFQVQVETALAGPGGLYKTEQRLRYLLGQPASDGRLIKPSSDPVSARVVFDWTAILNQSLERRVELRRQKWNVKRRELELCAAKLNKKPRLDFLGQYRWRGMGNHLLTKQDTALESLYGTITDGDYQEWQAGFELNFPVGLRRASTAIAHAQLNVSRERALLAESELRISHSLSDASRDLQRNFHLMQSNFNRWMADRHQVDVLRERYRNGADNINFLLQAQRQVVAAESEYYSTLTAYNLSMRDLHKEKGTLLAYNHIHMTEAGWHQPAYTDAYDRGRFLRPCLTPGAVSCGCPTVSKGPFDPSQSGVSTIYNGLAPGEQVIEMISDGPVGSDSSVLSPDKGASPASGGEKPASGGKTPASGGKTPAAGGKTPAAGGKPGKTNAAWLKSRISAAPTRLPNPS